MRHAIPKLIAAAVASVVVFALPASAGTATSPPPGNSSSAQAPSADDASGNVVKSASGKSARRGETWYFSIHNDLRERCILGQGTTPGNPVTQYDCTGLDDEFWNFAPGGWIQNLNSSLCLLAQGGAGGVATSYTCADFPDQRWVQDFDTVTNNHHFMLRRLGTNLCLAAPGGNGTQLSIWPCNAGFGDQWWNNPLL